MSEIVRRELTEELTIGIHPLGLWRTVANTPSLTVGLVPRCPRLNE